MQSKQLKLAHGREQLEPKCYGVALVGVTSFILGLVTSNKIYVQVKTSMRENTNTRRGKRRRTIKNVKQR